MRNEIRKIVNRSKMQNIQLRITNVHDFYEKKNVEYAFFVYFSTIVRPTNTIHCRINFESFRIFEKKNI